MGDLKAAIRAIPDFPQPGIVFRDLLPLLADPVLAEQVVDELAEFGATVAPDVVIGAEARGFLFGPALALRLGVGFVPVRKSGKLPGASVRQEYALEYGTDALEIHAEALRPGQRVLVHDDLLATGGTVAATIELARQLGADPVGTCFVVELPALAGRVRIGDIPTCSLVSFEGA